MLAQYDVCTSAEEEERAGAVRALGLALLQALVPDKRSLLVTSDTGNLHALEDAARALAVYLRRGDDLGEDRLLDLEKLEQAGVPLERVEVHEQRAGRVGDVSDVQLLVCTAGQTLGGLASVSRAAMSAPDTHVDDPGLDSTEEQVVFLVRLADILVVVDHPPQLYRGEVGRDGQPRPGARDRLSETAVSIVCTRSDSQLSESLNALVSLLEHARLSLNADALELVLEVRDRVLRPRVVPHDQPAQGLPGLAAPCNSALTLVGDTCKKRRMWEREDKSKSQICRLQELRGHLMMAVTHR